MSSAEILIEINQIMSYEGLTDTEKCIVIKDFCNNLANSDFINVLCIKGRKTE